MNIIGPKSELCVVVTCYCVLICVPGVLSHTCPCAPTQSDSPRHTCLTSAWSALPCSQCLSASTLSPCLTVVPSLFYGLSVIVPSCSLWSWFVPRCLQVCPRFFYDFGGFLFFACLLVARFCHLTWYCLPPACLCGYLTYLATVTKVAKSRQQ